MTTSHLKRNVLPFHLKNLIIQREKVPQVLSPVTENKALSSIVGPGIGTPRLGSIVRGNVATCFSTAEELPWKPEVHTRGRRAHYPRIRPP